MATQNIVDIVIRGINKSKQALTTPIKDLDDLKKAAIALKPAFATAVIGAASALAVFVQKSINAADEASKAAQKIGLTTEAYTTLNHAADQAGVESEQLKKAFVSLSGDLNDMANGSEVVAKKYKDLGISLKNSDGTLKTSEQLFKDVSDRIATLPAGFQRTGAAAKLFGDRIGADLIPLLKDGSGAITEMQERARRLGAEISTETGKQAEFFNDRLSDMGTILGGLGKHLAADLLPGLSAMAEGIVDATDKSSALGRSAAAIADGLGFIVKMALEVGNGIAAAFSLAGTYVAGFMNVIAQVPNGFDAMKEAGNQWAEESAKIIEDADKRHRAIWAEPIKVPPITPPPSQKPRIEDEKRTFIIAEFEKLQAVREASLEEVNIRIAAYNEKKKLTDKEAADYKSLYARRNQLAKESEDNQKKLDEARKSAIKDTGSFLLSSAKEVFAEHKSAYKALAIAEATMAGILAVQKVWASDGNYWVNLGLSALVAGITVANVAKISKMEGGGELQSNSPTGDKTMFKGNSGEWVFNKAQLNNLAQQLEGGGGMMAVTVNLEGQPILEYLGRSSRNGRLVLDAGAIV